MKAVSPQPSAVNPPRTGCLRTACAALAGAVVAAALGYGLSAAFSALGLALVAPAADARSSTALSAARAGLNFYAIHHVRIVGHGLPGDPTGTYVSILWPITIWAILPAAALMLGGFVSGRLSGARGPARFSAGAWLALPYVVLLLAGRWLVSVPSAAVALPEIPLRGTAFELLPGVLSPAAGGTIFHGLLLGIIFGGLGAIGGFGAIWRGLVRPDGFWPAWARGAFLALATGLVLFFFLLSAVFAVGLSHERRDREEMKPVEIIRIWTTLLPAGVGAADYLAHGVTLRGDIVTRTSIAGTRPVVQTYRAGLITGALAEGKTQRLPRWVFLASLVAAVALVLGGFVAARTDPKPTPRLALAARLAGMYALLLTALVPFFTLALRTAITAGGTKTWTTMTLGPSAAQAFAFGLVFGFVFALIGVSIYRQNARA